MIASLMPLLLVGAAPPADAPAPGEPIANAAISPFPDCRSPQLASGNDNAIFNRLGDLPPAHAYQAVIRAGPDGCLDPLLVTERIGWNERQSKK